MLHPLLRGTVACLLGSLLVGCQIEDMTPGRDRDYRADFPAMPAEGLINVVVEIPAGTQAKWHVAENGKLEWETVNDTPRVVRYLPYPANYGMVPRTMLSLEGGGDGDPLDVVLLGPVRERGVIVQARPVGVLLLTDEGQRDDKIIAVELSGPFSDVVDLAELEAGYPGTTAILRTWFTHYEGAAGTSTSAGYEGAEQALVTVIGASRAYEAATAR